MKLFCTLLATTGLFFAGCTSTTHPAAVDEKNAGPSGPRAIRPDLPTIPDRKFNVRGHGAKGDGAADDTAALQSAIDAARKVGGGIVEIPAGVYLSGPLQFASNLNLHLASGATLKMLPLDRYPGGTQRGEDFLSGANLHDLALTGAGMIDGQGEPWWPFAQTPRRLC